MSAPAPVGRGIPDAPPALSCGRATTFSPPGFYIGNREAREDSFAAKRALPDPPENHQGGGLSMPPSLDLPLSTKERVPLPLDSYPERGRIAICGPSYDQS